MAEVYPRVAKADTSVGCSERHLFLRRGVVVLHGPHKVLRQNTQRLEAPHVGDGVRALPRQSEARKRDNISVAVEANGESYYLVISFPSIHLNICFICFIVFL
jgi:hypothetical protein